MAGQLPKMRFEIPADGHLRIPLDQLPKNPRATLWLLAYGGIQPNTHLSICGELAVWPNLVNCVKAGDANIDRARSRVASAFLAEPREEAGDVLLMVDADNAWEQGDLAFIAKRALEHNAVVGGIYPKRAFNQGPALRVTEGAEGDYKIGEDALIPCEFVGTGFIAIPRSILEAISNKLQFDWVKGGFQPFFMPYVTMNEQLEQEYPTDDQAFCYRVRNVGFQVLASTFPRVSHDGQYTFRLIDGQVVPPPDQDIEIHLTKPVREAVPA